MAIEVVVFTVTLAAKATFLFLGLTFTFLKIALIQPIIEKIAARWSMILGLQLFSLICL